MFKRTLPIAILFSMANAFAFAQVTLTIDIVNLRNNQGSVLLGLYDGHQAQVMGLAGAIKNGRATFRVDNLVPGKYAFKFFHDEDNNGRMAANALGIPEEGFVFSNNARGFMGPPAFEKWVFELDGNKTIQCQPKYF